MDWLIGIFPIALVILLCPLMMFFMMRGMHGGQTHTGPTASPALTDNDELTRLREEVSALREEAGTRR